MSGDPFVLVASLGLLVVSVAFHEVAHGRVALAFGDSTAAEQGRLSLNPLRHLDPLMSVALPVFLLLMNAPVFGAARPVPVNLSRLRPPSSAMLVAAAGPATNLALALGIGVLWAVALRTGVFAPTASGTLVLQHAVEMNFFLAAFNLVPVPPLDGSRVLGGLFPRSIGRAFAAIEPFAFVLLFALVLGGAFGWVYEVSAAPWSARWFGFLERTILRGG